MTTADGHGDSDSHKIAVTITPTGATAPALLAQALFSQAIAGFVSHGAGTMSFIPAIHPPRAMLAAHH